MTTRRPSTASSRLQVQLSMLSIEFGAPRSIFDVREKMREMGPATKRLFGQVESETLVRLILVCRVMSCEAEQSFSALRTVKSRMRNCMGQFFSNSSLMCAVYKARLDELEVDRIASESVKCNKSCARVFGNMKRYERHPTHQHQRYAQPAM